MEGRIAFLVALGLIGPLADVSSLPTLRRVASATAATAVRGGEPFARTIVEWDGDRRDESLTIPAAAFDEIDGPSARRVMYARAMAVPSPGDERAGDDLDLGLEALRETVRQRALCGEAPVLGEMGLTPPSAPRLRLRHGPSEAAPTAVVRCP